ncbi:NRDE family protein [Halomonas sp. LS-001]
MCLLAFDWQPQTPTPLRLIGNRDEFHERPTRPLHHWNHAPITGGKDLEAGGSWLAVNHMGRVAALTNVRDPRLVTPPNAPSRGELVRQALTCPNIESWLETLRHEANGYAGFNLLVATPQTLWHMYRGREHISLTRVSAGVHVLSNANLDTPWPKAIKLKDALLKETRYSANGAISRWPEASLEAIQQSDEAAWESLPDTGIDQTLEKKLSAAFIVGENYGTRATTWLTLQRDGRIRITEQSFGPMAAPAGEVTLEVGSTRA